MAKSTAECTFTADATCILTIGEEDGELKILQIQQYTGPQQQSAFESAKAEVEAKAASAS